MEKTRSKISGNTLEERLFRLIIILSIGMAFSWLLYRVFYFKNITLIILHASSTTIFLLLFFWYLKTKAFEVVSLVYYLVIMLFLTFGYFPSGGSYGAAVFLSIIAYCTGLLVLTPKFTFFFSSLFITLFIVLSLIEYMFPELVQVGDLKRGISIGKIVVNFVLFVTLGLFLYYFKKEYVSDEHKKQLQNTQLRKEKEKLESSEKYINKFLNTIWQELNAPMGSINMILGKLSKTNLDQNQKSLISRLQKNNELLNSIISDIIDVSKVGLGKASLRKISFSIYPEIRELIDILENTNNEKKAIYSIKYSKEVPLTLVGDPVRLKQTISSLINSASQFMKGIEVIINVSLLFRSEKTCTIRINLNCKGAGISKSMKAEMFDRYYNNEQQKNDLVDVDLLLPKTLTETMGGAISFSFDQKNDFNFYLDVPFEIDLTNPQTD